MILAADDNRGGKRRTSGARRRILDHGVIARQRQKLLGQRLAR